MPFATNKSVNGFAVRRQIFQVDHNVNLQCGQQRWKHILQVKKSTVRHDIDAEERVGRINRYIYCARFENRERAEKAVIRDDLNDFKWRVILEQIVRINLDFHRGRAEEWTEWNAFRIFPPDDVVSLCGEDE